MNTRTVRSATQPQLDYIRKLRNEVFDIHRELKVIAGDTEAVEALDDDARALTTDTKDVRDIRHASQLIDHGKETTRRLRAELAAARATVAEINAIVDDAAVAAAPAAAAAAASVAPAEAPFDPQTLEIGIYRVGETIYKVKPNRDKTRKYAERLIYTVGEAKRLTEAGTEIKAEYEFARGAIYRIRPDNRVTGQEAEELSIVFNSCIACGRHLKAAESVAAGIGPVCRKKWGL